MTQMEIQLAIFAAQQLIKNEPAIAAEISKLMTKGDATEEEWRAVYALSQKPWESFGQG